jgi:hypothetical protein
MQADDLSLLGIDFNARDLTLVREHANEVVPGLTPVSLCS